MVPVSYTHLRGAYHFYIPGTDALKQADFFIRTVKLDSGDLPPVLDVEAVSYTHLTYVLFMKK